MKRIPLKGEPLTDIEYRCARLLADGLTKKEIAAKLRLGYNTIVMHHERVYKKLGVKRAVLVARWVWEKEQAWITPRRTEQYSSSPLEQARARTMC